MIVVAICLAFLAIMLLPSQAVGDGQLFGRLIVSGLLVWLSGALFGVGVSGI